jgi:hypothetical protein
VPRLTKIEIAMCNLSHHNYALVATSAVPLKAFITKTLSDNDLMREYGQEGIRTFGLLLTQFALNMAGPVERPTVMTGEVMIEEDFRTTFASAEYRLLIAWLNHFCLKLAYFFGDYDRAEKFSRITDDFATVTGSHPFASWHAMFSSLTAFAMARKARDPLRRRMQWRRALRFAQQVQNWSDAGNVNCLHLTQLLEAERLSFLKRKEMEAKRMYNAAIASAQKNGYLNDKALAHELAFLFHLRLAAADQRLQPSAPRDTPYASKGEDDGFWAQNHYKDAVEAYSDWNAFQKVKQLVDTYEDHFRVTAS